MVEEPSTLLELYEQNSINGKLIHMIKTSVSFVHLTDEYTKLKVAASRNDMMEEIHKVVVKYPNNTIHFKYQEIIYRSNVYDTTQYPEVVCIYYLLPE